jgi:nitrite reductase/ring-hydroxylating ferredoxin subunit
VKKLIGMVLALVVMAALTLGCAGYVSKETKVKCPKCGAVFTIDEGLKNMPPSAP